MVRWPKLIGVHFGPGEGSPCVPKRAESLEVQGKVVRWVPLKNVLIRNGKALVKPVKTEVMTRRRIKLTAVWGNDDAQSSVLVSRRQWTAIQSGAELSIDSSSSYEGNRQWVVWRFANGQVSIDGEDGMECVVCLPVGELIIEDRTSTAS